MDILPDELIAHIALIDNNSKSVRRNTVVMLMLTCKRFYDAIYANYLCKECMEILNMRNHINKDIAYMVECTPPHCTKINRDNCLTFYDLNGFDNLEIIRWSPDEKSASYMDTVEVTEKKLCDYGYCSTDYYTIIKFAPYL